jgi:hypothetical protein
LLERFLELLERVHMLHGGGERSISYEAAQLLVNLLDLCARRLAYPIDEPESVEAKAMASIPSGLTSWRSRSPHTACFASADGPRDANAFPDFTKGVRAPATMATL